MALVAFAPSATFAAYVGKGSSGAEVSRLQTWLIGNGYPIPLIESGNAQKGYFGNQTKDAVLMYQEDHSLSQTGSIDTQDIFQTKASPVLGASASYDFPSRFFSVGGVRHWAGSTNNLIQASSTVCSIQGPAATSTLIAAGIRFTLASTTAVIVDLAKDQYGYSTTTALNASIPLAASTQGTIIASTTSNGLDTTRVFPPSYFFTVRIAGGATGSTGTGNVPTGYCFAEWIQI